MMPSSAPPMASPNWSLLGIAPSCVGHSPQHACLSPGWSFARPGVPGKPVGRAGELRRAAESWHGDHGRVGAFPWCNGSWCGRGGAWTAAYPFPAWSACAATSVPATGLSLRSPRAATDLFPAAGLVVPASPALSLICLSPLGKHLGRPGRPVAGPSCAALAPDRREGPRSPQAATRAAVPPGHRTREKAHEPDHRLRHRPARR